MKKIILSLMFLSTAAVVANAASKTKPKDQPARIDHSMDQAYSARWADEARPPAPNADFSMDNAYITGSYLKGQTWYYGLNNFTVHGIMAVSMNAPYNGHDAPSWDGPIKNEYRNMRAYKSNVVLPPNDGTLRKK
jgi:hypothetical protein